MDIKNIFTDRFNLWNLSSRYNFKRNYALYNFDRKLRIITIEYILEVEKQENALMIYTFSKNHDISNNWKHLKILHWSLYYFERYIFDKLPNQPHLLPPCHLFDLPLSFHSLLFRFKCLIIGKFHRQPCLGVFCSFSCIMTGNAFLQIVCPACIISSVTAFYYICIIHMFFLPLW